MGWDSSDLSNLGDELLREAQRAQEIIRDALPELAKPAGEAGAAAVAEVTPRSDDAEDEAATTHLADTTVPGPSIEQLNGILIPIEQLKTVYWRRENIRYPVAKFLIYGHRAFTVTPLGTSKGGADALFWPGADHPVPSANIPELDPNPYPEDAVPVIQNALTLLADRWSKDVLASLLGAA